MALIKSVRGFTPEIGENCFLADNAVVIGDVKTGRDCSIWFSTVLRGDVNSIRIGERSKHPGWKRAPHLVREIDHRDRRPRIRGAQRDHPRSHYQELCFGRDGFHHP